MDRDVELSRLAREYAALDESWFALEHKLKWRKPTEDAAETSELSTSMVELTGRKQRALNALLFHVKSYYSPGYERSHIANLTEFR